MLGTDLKNLPGYRYTLPNIPLEVAMHRNNYVMTQANKPIKLVNHFKLQNDVSCYDCMHTST